MPFQGMDSVLGLCRVWLSLIMLIICSSSQVLPPAGAAPTASPPIGLPPGIDIAISQPVTASSETSAEPAFQSVDGDAETAWCPNEPNTSAELTVRFDQPYDLNGTAITWRERAPSNYELQISVDGRHWQAFGGQPTSTSMTQTWVDHAAGLSVLAAFIRLRFSDPTSLPCV